MATKDQSEKAWNNAKAIRGKSPDKYRQDPYCNTMFKPSHGKSSGMGWDVDHIKPKSKGGKDTTRNFQALNSAVNRSKGNTQIKKSRHSATNK